MSKGLGKLRKEILDTLIEAKNKIGPYKCKDFTLDGYNYDPELIKIRGIWVKLADNIFDLRASLNYLAKKHNRFCGCYIDSSLIVSFSRAVKSLVKRGHIEPLISLLPIKEVLDEDEIDSQIIHALSDGLYLALRFNNRIRFVKKPKIGNIS